MARYSPIAPVEVLLQMKERGFLNNYLLLLAHEIIAKPHLYKQLLEGFDGTIILDNSLIELGVPVPMDTMVMAASIVNPTFIVLPDKLNEAEVTIAMAKESIQQYGKKFLSNVGYMIAAQGKDPDEALWCVEQITTMHKDVPFMVGVPREVTNRQGSRIPLVNRLTLRNFQVHLLGMSNNLSDDIACTKMYGVKGIDSASPLRAGWEGKKYNGDTSTLRPRNEYFELCRGYNVDMAYNVGMIEGLIGAYK